MMDAILRAAGDIAGWIVVGLASIGLLVLVSAAFMGGWRR